jgi:LacI family transcriptional regulator
MALGVLDAAAARGLQCPQDVSVVGFNDMPFADRFEPTLTTVRVAKYDLGQRAAELLLALIHDPAHRPETVVIAPDLVVRNSTGPPGCALSIPADSGHAQLSAAR